MMYANPPRPMGPGKARRLPRRAFTTLFQNLCTSDAAASHCDDKGWQRHTAKPNAIPSRDFPSIPNVLVKGMIGSLRCASPQITGVLQLHQISSCELDHNSPMPLSWTKELSLFDSHSAFGNQMPHPFLCRDNTALPILSFPFLCGLLHTKHASQNQPAAAPTCLSLNVINVEASLQCVDFLSSPMLTHQLST